MDMLMCYLRYLSTEDSTRVLSTEDSMHCVCKTCCLSKMVRTELFTEYNVLSTEDSTYCVCNTCCLPKMVRTDYRITYCLPKIQHSLCM